MMELPQITISGFTLNVSNPILNSAIRSILLIEQPRAELKLGLIIVILIAICFKQTFAFSRPPPVQRKVLPRRPALQILFKPDDITSHQEGSISSVGNNGNSVPSRIFTTESVSVDEVVVEEDDNDDDDESTSFSIPTSGSGGKNKKKKKKLRPQDLPDSFAPLLSSSQMEVIYEELTSNLLHALNVEANVRLRQGRHEIPLDKDTSRPQLILDIPKGGCRVAAVFTVGSDGFSVEDDLNPATMTKDRSLPMVKHAGVIFDCPLPLANVAPTLIHFPTLFEDNTVKFTLRRIQIVRYALDFIMSISSFIEKVLWIIESKCQIHLGKIKVTPLYKGSLGDDGREHEPQWRLSLAFSGHVMLFGWIPIPFVNVTLPTWIIPQPHALLEHLLTSQPLASAKVKREAIAEQRVAIAIVDTIETWQTNIDAVATPPALSVDLTLPGGITIAVEAMHGTDVSGGRPRGEVESGHGIVESNSHQDSLSSCTMFSENEMKSRYRRSRPKSYAAIPASYHKPFDANSILPWKLSASMKGKVEQDKISVVVSKMVAEHKPESSDTNFGFSDGIGSKLSLSGNFVICKPDNTTLEKTRNPQHIKRISWPHLPNLHKPDLAFDSGLQSVASILLFPENQGSSVTLTNRQNNLLHYDYSFEMGNDTVLDSVSLSVGAFHPMLKGGTIITTILESIYAYGSFSARENSIFDMSELGRKRNVLMHLPAVDFTAGINNIFIPEESMSFSDDAQTKCIPELIGGQIMMRVTGGFENDAKSMSSGQTTAHLSRDENPDLYVSDGVKVVVDFGVASLALNNETRVNDFPEIEVFEDQRLHTILAGSIDGTIGFHLRPQALKQDRGVATEKNVYNPLEAYELDFSGSNVSVKITEANSTLGHRRLIIPSESSFGVHIIHSVVDMSFDGTTQCELNWDFQGNSPILQATALGMNPHLASHEEKRQVNLLISSLRQGRFNLNVSSVGGLTITQASTTREDREGLYDWKFFNAIVSPSDESAGHIFKVLHDRRSMLKTLQVIKLINRDLEKLLSYLLKQVWRAKEIFDSEGVSDPGHAIPGHKMARLLSLFVCGDDSQVSDILPIVRRVVSGNGLDVLATKELLRKNLKIYEDYSPEIDRIVRWGEVMLGSMPANKPFEEKLSALSEDERFKSKFSMYPSAKAIYDIIEDKRHLPLEPSFSNMVSVIAPYMSFSQITYILASRPSHDWQPIDLKRIRYVYAIKKKVLEINESYGGLSFMPQSFFVSVFLGEATRASLRASHRYDRPTNLDTSPSDLTAKWNNATALKRLRKKPNTDNEARQRLSALPEEYPSDFDMILSPAGRVASLPDLVAQPRIKGIFRGSNKSFRSPSQSDSRASIQKSFDIGDSLLGPSDVAILLQAGLTSSMKGSTVVQLNQRMLLDLMASQPRLFSVAVLCEIGSPDGQGNPRGLTSALMALLELDQSSFVEFHRINMHQLLESWLSGIKIPRREDYLAGGRWASQSYYDAIYAVALSILEDGKEYIAFKGYIQRVRHHAESDPVPTAKEVMNSQLRPVDSENSLDNQMLLSSPEKSTKLAEAISQAKQLIEESDEAGKRALKDMNMNSKSSVECEAAQEAIRLYNSAFEACRQVIELDNLAFHAEWLKIFYRRNYDALMVKSVYDNIMEDTDQVREWMQKLKVSSLSGVQQHNEVDFFKPENHSEQELLDVIVDLLFYDDKEKKNIHSDPLVRLLIPNPPGNYDFTIVSAMGVITEGKRGVELEEAFKRLERRRGVLTIRSDTGTARTLEYNALKIQDAIKEAVALNRPYGLLGYSQGCANALLAESLLLSGSPSQQKMLSYGKSKLVCRQLLFSAANGSMHGPAMEAKIHRLIVMCESFFKYQQGYCSKAFISTVLETLTGIMDSAAFQKFIAGGGGTFLHSGSRAFWREAQHVPSVPTSVIRGVMEDNTTPESLEMISNLLTKAANSHLHDSQVHVYDAVGRPVYTKNRNAKLLEHCDMGGSIQRTHHWSPLREEVRHVETQKDQDRGMYLCAKDRHIFPWVDVNCRFGFIKYAEQKE